MLVEIPDLDVLLGLVAAFVAGLVALVIYYKARPYVNLRHVDAGPNQQRRLDEYERQLVEMRIRVDAMSLGGVMDTSHDVTSVQDAGVPEVPKPSKIVPKTAPGRQVTSNITHHNAVEFVLSQITTSPKTSRDIQTGLGKTREHTSRLLKRLYDNGLVKRNTSSKPYTYSITDEGRKRLDSDGKGA